jgi:hypothetical protein
VWTGFWHGFLGGAAGRFLFTINPFMAGATSGVIG